MNTLLKYQVPVLLLLTMCTDQHDQTHRKVQFGIHLSIMNGYFYVGGDVAEVPPLLGPPSAAGEQQLSDLEHNYGWTIVPSPD
jgi:hypothetical protein